MRHTPEHTGHSHGGATGDIDEDNDDVVDNFDDLDPCDDVGAGAGAGVGAGVGVGVGDVDGVSRPRRSIPIEGVVLATPKGVRLVDIDDALRETGLVRHELTFGALHPIHMPLPHATPHDVMTAVAHVLARDVGCHGIPVLSGEISSTSPSSDRRMLLRLRSISISYAPHTSSSSVATATAASSSSVGMSGLESGLVHDVAIDWAYEEDELASYVQRILSNAFPASSSSPPSHTVHGVAHGVATMPMPWPLGMAHMPMPSTSAMPPGPSSSSASPAMAMHPGAVPFHFLPSVLPPP